MSTLLRLPEPAGNDRESWAIPVCHPKLASDAVHVWRATIAEHAVNEAAFFELLDSPECERARRFHFERDRRQYVVAHGLLRSLLARYLAEPAERLVFETGPFGKPRLAAAAASVPLNFNLSHSGDLVVIAVALGRACGVDVEQWDDEIQHAALAAFCFSDAERRMLADVPASQTAAAFYAAWTRKEAYIKATGFGVSQGLDHFDVTLTPGMPARLLRDRHIPAATARWTMHDLDAGVGYSGAVVAEGSQWRLDRYAYVAQEASLSA